MEDSGRTAAAEHPGGQRTGAPWKGRSGRMTSAVEEEDKKTTMAVDRGLKSGQVLEGEGRCFYI
jgi:hypothetical protein